MNAFEEKKPLLILSGPTAVGKTAVSVELAKIRGLDIASGKIKKEEMQGVPHHLLDILNPEEEYDASIFQRMAREKTAEIYARGHLPILVGGTGFYIQAMLRDIDFQEEDGKEKTEIRKTLHQALEERGSGFLHEELKRVDPVSAEKIHAHNKQRILRALEYYFLHHRPISLHNAEEKEKEALYDSLFLVLDREREALYKSINSRVEKMFREGLVSEVERFYQRGYSEDAPAFSGIGYREVFPYLRGEYDLSRCMERIQQNSRHYAKRQLTWFRREKEAVFVEREDFQSEKELVKWIVEKCIKKWEFLKKSCV